MDPRVYLIIAGLAGLFWVGEQTVKGIKKLDHDAMHHLTRTHKGTKSTAATPQEQK